MPQQVAIVTGSSKGLGAAAAQLLARRGFAVVVNYKSDEGGADRVVEDIERHSGGVAHKVGADVTVPADVERLVSETLDKFGRLDVLVSNARFPHVQKPIADISLEEFESKIHVEIRAAFLLTQAAIVPMTRQGGGRLIYVSSDHAVGPSAPGNASHGTSKAALNTFAKYVAHETGRRHITANVVQCGLMDTPAVKGLSPEFRETFAARIPLGYVASADDVAGVIAFLASSDSRFVTGAVIRANGGMGLSQFCFPDAAPSVDGP